MFVDKLRQLVEEQQREAEKAVVGCGKYYLQCQYSELAVPQTRWFAMNKELRQKKLKKFNAMHVLAVGDGPCTSNSTFDSCPTLSSTNDAESDSVPFTVDSTLTESVQPSLCQPITATLLSNKLSILSDRLGLPPAAIDGIASKAVEILCTDGAIVPAPGYSSEAKMVISRSGKRPHLILPKKKCGGLSCDDDCPQYKSAKLCVLIL